MPWRTCGGQLVGVGFPLLSWEVPGSLRSLCLWQVPLPVEPSRRPLGFPWVLSVVSKIGLGSLLEPECSENPSRPPFPPYDSAVSLEAVTHSSLFIPTHRTSLSPSPEITLTLQVSQGHLGHWSRVTRYTMLPCLSLCPGNRAASSNEVALPLPSLMVIA